MSRLENAPSRTEVARLMRAKLEHFLDSYAKAPKRIVLDIDDTLDVVHGGQQLALFNAHYDEHCFLPIHIYEAVSGKPVAMILRAGKTPSGVEVRTILKHLIRHIRARWPKVGIVVRGDSHYGRIEAMQWCENNDVDYIFGLSGNDTLRVMIEPKADAIRVNRALSGADKVRGYCSVKYAAKTWPGDRRRVVARMEATTMGFDTRYVITSLSGAPRHLYENVYCRRGEMENLIKLHKSQLGSDRTSCHSAVANQFRLILHSCAYWLLHGLRAAAPRKSGWARVEFATLRLRLIKVAARVVENIARIRVSLPTSCPDKELFVAIAMNLRPRPP